MGFAFPPKVCAQLTILFGFVVYHLAFTSLGIATIIADRSLKEDPCGKSTHLWKYVVLNTMFSAATLGTFGIFPGGGEGARARALMITILHFGFVAWGGLLWTKLPECLDIISTKHHQIYMFHVLCVWHNAFFLVLYTLHELYLGEKVGGDLTLMPEVNKHVVYDYDARTHYAEIAQASPNHHQNLMQNGSESQPPTYLQTPGTAPVPTSETLQHLRHGKQDLPGSKQDSVDVKVVFSPPRDL